MSLTKKILLSITLAVLIGHGDLYAMEKEIDNSDRRKIGYILTEGCYQEYLDLKNKTLPFLENLKTRVFPLYELRKEGRPQIVILGTGHESPVDVLYSCFWNYFQKAEEIYVENSRFDWLSNLSQAQSELNLDEESLKKYENSPLQSFLKIFNKDVEIRNLTLKQLFYFVYAAPYFFGTDTGLMFQALHEKKPTYMLDKESDLNSACTLIIKVEEENDEVNQNNFQEKLKINEEEYIKYFLNSSKGFEKVEFVEKNTQEYLDYYSEEAKNLELDFKNKELEQDDPLDIYETKIRNEQWFNILDSNTENSKLVAVGFHHLEGLLPLFKEACYTVKKIPMESIK